MDGDPVSRALKTKAMVLNLSRRKLRELPDGIPGFRRLVALQRMEQLTELNLGNNAFEETPSVLKRLHNLKKLHLFRNQISTLDPAVLEGLSNLTVLNLNHNKIRILPTAIKSLAKLEKFSIAGNQLEEIPAELRLLRKLTELDFSHNRLSGIPHELYELTRLRKLSLARNTLEELPQGILGWKNLKILDVAGNRLSVLPTDFQLLDLEEFYFEGNDFVRSESFTSTQDEEVFSLKEHAARVILRERLHESSVVSEALTRRPDVHAALRWFGRCAVCFRPFLTSWVECVRFINLRKDMGIKNCRDVPVRSLLCSYSCFNKKSGCCYYRICKIKS